MKHELKLRIEYADAVNSGMKSFEIRKDDRGYQRGDTVKFKVIDNCGVHIEHPVEEKEYLIGYVLHGWGLEQNWCAFSIRKLPVIKAAPDPEFQMPKINLKDFSPSPIMNTVRLLSYDKMPAQLGQQVTLVWYDADRKTWRTEKQPVTGVGFEGFRLSAHPVIMPLDSTDLFSWDELGKEVFLTEDLALKEADRRNREGIRP